MRHVLSLDDLTTTEIQRVIEIAADLKAKLAKNERPSLLANHVMGMLFEKPSLRTRVSFETLIRQLGGSSLFLGKDVGWGEREPMQDFMPILTGYLDVLVIRAKRHDKVIEATKFSQCPIINGLTDVSHPCQALADILTVQEIAGTLTGQKIAYLGDGNNVAFSLALACAKLGVEFRIGAPVGYQFEQSMIDRMNGEANQTLVTQTADPNEAVDGANFVYTDVWTSMGQEAETKKRLADFADYQVNADIMSRAADEAKLLHCLPARRGEEVTSEVIDSPTSAVIQQANNRLHAQKGLVTWLLGVQ